jgi:hypothetical protein
LKLGKKVRKHKKDSIRFYSESRRSHIGLENQCGFFVKSIAYLFVAVILAEKTFSMVRETVFIGEVYGSIEF